MRAKANIRVSDFTIGSEIPPDGTKNIVGSAALQVSGQVANPAIIAAKAADKPSPRFLRMPLGS